MIEEIEELRREVANRAHFEESYRTKIAALEATVRRARNIIIDVQNFIGPTSVWRDEELMERTIREFIDSTREHL